MPLHEAVAPGLELLPQRLVPHQLRAIPDQDSAARLSARLRQRRSPPHRTPTSPVQAHPSRAGWSGRRLAPGASGAWSSCSPRTPEARARQRSRGRASKPASRSAAPVRSSPPSGVTRPWAAVPASRSAGAGASAAPSPRRPSAGTLGPPPPGDDVRRRRPSCCCCGCCGRGGRPRRRRSRGPRSLGTERCSWRGDGGGCPSEAAGYCDCYYYN
eukprot:scaffold932_cov299-Prasinococcus_capsulatus_cf.AAC.2